MKKGLFGAFIGLIFFMGVVNFIFVGSGATTIMSIMVPIFIFVIAVIFISIIKKAAEANPEYQKHYSDNSHIPDVHCHKCQSLIEQDANYCPVCGASQKNTIICEYCGHENPKTNALCEKCNGFL